MRGRNHLAWVEFGDGHSNFSAPGSFSWQVHGGADAEVLAWCARYSLPLHISPSASAAAYAGCGAHAVDVVRPTGTWAWWRRVMI